MTMGALVHAGADPVMVMDIVGRLGVDGYALTFEPVLRCGIAATHAVVVTDAFGHETPRDPIEGRHDHDHDHGHDHGHDYEHDHGAFDRRAFQRFVGTIKGQRLGDVPGERPAGLFTIRAKLDRIAQAFTRENNIGCHDNPPDIAAVRRRRTALTTTPPLLPLRPSR